MRRTPMTIAWLLPVVLVTLAGSAQPQTKKAATKKAPPAARAEEAAPQAFPIESIRVEGSKLYPADKVIAATGLKVGEPGDAKVFEAARDRLVATGVFESVGFRFTPAASKKGFAVVFEVSEVEQIYPIRFDRVPVSEPEVREHLRQKFPMFGDRVPGTKDLMEAVRRAVEDFVVSKGHVDAISSRMTFDQNPNDLYLLFYPTGSPPVVAEVAFRGSEVIPATALQMAIHGVAIGIEYRESRFRELLDTQIRPLYEARGRIRVSFPKVEIAALTSVQGLKVTVDVVEGASYTFKELRVDGTETMNDELAKVAAIKGGEVANFETVKASQARIIAAMRRNGYMKASSTMERQIDDEKKTVSVVVQVTPGRQYNFGKLKIEGLDLNGEFEMKRLWTMAPGRVFNADYPDYFLNRMREDGIFDNLGKTRAIVTLNDKDLIADVTLEFGKAETPKPGTAPIGPPVF